MGKSGVYFISDGKYVKVGKGNNPLQRLKNMQTGNVNQLDLLIYLPYECEDDAFMIERILHYSYKKRHVRGEWYDILSDIHPGAIAVCFADEECFVCKNGNLVDVFDGTNLTLQKVRKKLGVQPQNFKRYQAKTDEEAVQRLKDFFNSRKESCYA